VTRLIQALHALALAFVCAILAPIAYELYHQRPAFESDVRRASALIGRAEETMKNFKEATTEWKNASQKQSESATRALSSTRETLASLNSLVKRTDASLNESVLPSLASAVTSQNQALLTTQADLQAELSLMAQATAEAQKVLADADAQISSPDVKIALDNFAASSQNLSAATAEGAASMKDVHLALDYEIKQLEAPVTKAKVAWNFALNIIRHLYF